LFFQLFLSVGGRMLEFLLPGIIICAAGFGAIFLFTRRGGRARAWVTATPNRITGTGIAILILLWIGVATYNEATRVDLPEGKSAK
jgi:heme/copper-type cytochrome/quinol oxidase subunit 2